MDELSRRSRSAGSQGRTAARSGAAQEERLRLVAAELARLFLWSRSTRSGSSYNSRGRSAGAAGRGSYDRRPPVSHGRNSKRRKNSSPNYLWIAVAGVVLIIAIAIAVLRV